MQQGAPELSPGARVAVVGAGISGLVAARTLRDFGFDVTVFDRTPDVGGVWSATRRYPGLATQNSKRTYRFSDLEMPAAYPETPAAEQMQAYLATYARIHDLERCARLATEVTSARPDGDGWLLTSTPTAQGVVSLGRTSTERFDHLVVANGIFCEPHVPDHPGAEEFARAGGRLIHSAAWQGVTLTEGTRVVVVGHGKSACDIAAALADRVASVDLVARRLLWKMPRGAAGDYERVALSRLGEAMFPHLEPGRLDRLLNGPARFLRDRVFRRLEVQARDRLGPLGLVPNGRFEDIAKSSVSLETPGFVELVRSGAVVVHRDAEIVRLAGTRSGPEVELTDGPVLPADLVVCATGHRQQVPFLPDEVRARLVDDRGDFVLYRHIHPVDVPGLSFVGYNSSLVSALNAEIASVWVAAKLTGRLVLPAADVQRRQVARRLAWMDRRTGGRSAHGTSVVPFSIRNLDEMLEDLDVRIGRRARLREYVAPIDPSAYAHVRRVVLARAPAAASSALSRSG